VAVGEAEGSGVDLPSRRAGVLLAGVLALAALVLLIPAGGRIFWSSDEARFALLAQDILDHGRWLVPDLRGRPYLNKPQLQFWAIALVSAPIGRVTEFTAALPAIVASLGTVGGVVAIGRNLWGWRAGLVAGLVLVSTPPVFAFGHVALPDMMLASWMTWALYWLVRAWRSDWALRPLVVLYVCVGLAVASKGPAGYAALAGALVAVGGTDGPRGLRRLRPALGLAVLATCAAPWVIPYQLHPRGHFVGQVLGGHYVSWYFRGAWLDRGASLTEAIGGFLPWTIFLAAAPWWWRRAPDPGRRRVVLWTVTVWCLLGISGTIRARYFLPIYPLFALLTGELLARATSRRRLEATRVAAWIFAVGALAVGLAVVVLPGPLLGGEDAALSPVAAWERWTVFAIVAAGGVAVWVFARRGAFPAVATTAGVTLVSLLVLAGITYPARYARDNDVRPLASAAAAHVGAAGTVIGHPDLRLSYDFYLRRPVREIADEGEMRTFLASPGAEAVILPAARWQGLAPQAAPSWRVLARARVAGREMVVVGVR